MGDAYLADIQIDAILPDPDQPRVLPPLDELIKQVKEGDHRAQEIWNKLLELATSILEVGLEQPVSVYPAQEDGKYILYDGHRRWMAMRILQRQGHGNGKIPCLVRMEHRSEADTLIGQINTNMQREELNVFELARNLEKMYEVLKEQGGQVRLVREDGSIDIEEVKPGESDDKVWALIERRAGIGRTRRYQVQAVLKLPSYVQGVAEDAGLPESRLRYLIPIKEEPFLEQLIHEIVEKNLPNADIKKRIDELQETTKAALEPQVPKPRHIKSAVKHVRQLAEEMTAVRNVNLAIMSKDPRTIASYKEAIPELKAAIKDIEVVLAELRFLANNQ